jgi:hypothetical protein
MIARVQVKGIRKVLDRLDPQRWLLVIDAVLARMAAETHRIFVERAPRRTGRLVASAYLVSPRRGTWVMRVDAPYAAVVEFGSRPHTIRPRRAKALRFEVGGHVVFARYIRKGDKIITPKHSKVFRFEVPRRVVFAKKVEHPGTKGQFIIAKALDKVMRKIREFFKDSVRDVIGSV